jgi:hypothetical protein
LAEETEQYIDEWWFQRQDEDLHKFLCIDTLKYCCPDDHYGADCKPCPGFPNNVCNKSGKCKVGCCHSTAVALHILALYVKNLNEDGCLQGCCAV